jgi:hypothetical protein
LAKREWQKTRDLIAVALRILEQESPMTIRQLFYRIVSAGVIENNRGSYQMVSRVMTTSRKDGRCPYDFIVDRSRPEYVPNVFENAAEYAEAVKRSYRKNYWESQPNHVEIWTEKDAVIGSIQQLTNDLGVTVRVGRGFSSTTKKHEISCRFQQIGHFKSIFVLYLGDFDPSGMAIEDNLRYTIDAYFTMERLAIHQADILAFNLPPLRVKLSDSRSDEFLITHGSECVELDALPPTELRRRIEKAVKRLQDKAKWKRAIAVEKVELASIVSSVGDWKNLPMADV